MAFIFLATSTSGCPSSSLLRILAVRAFTAILTNDSFKGLDQFSKVEVDVIEKATNRQTYDYSKEDIKAIKEPTLLQSALEIEEEETDEDEDLDEADELRNKLRAAGLTADGARATTAQ